MRLELLKLIVQPVILERSEDGTIKGEKVGEATPLYVLDDLLRFREALETQIAVANANLNGHSEEDPQNDGD